MEKEKKTMKTKTIILITALVTIAILVGGFFAWQYELDRNELSYNEGYTYGTLYTFQSGNVVIVDQGNLTEVSIEQICNTVLQNS